MIVTKLPTEFTASDWTTYTLKRAVELGVASPFEMRGPIKRAFTSLLKQDIDAYGLLLAVEHLLVSSFKKEVGIGSRLLAYNTIDRALQDIGLPSLHGPYKYRYFERFVSTLGQEAFWTHWRGEIYVGISTDNDALLQLCVDKFDIACERIGRILEEKGSLEQWPTIVRNTRHALVDKLHCTECSVRWFNENGWDNREVWDK